MTKKITLKGMNENELKRFCLEQSLPSFHGAQLYHWMYKKKEYDLNEMKNIPKSLLNLIKNIGQINTLKIKKRSFSKIDNTTKYLLETLDNKYIEAVSMLDNNRHTVCISSQIGCNVDCDFCATGKMGITRNLNVGEIIDQLILIINNLKIKVNNIVFMGMGEPFLNYANVLKACRIFCDTKAFNLGAKRITISTSGILPKINLFIKEEHKYKLAISLNAPNDKLRSALIPINKKWSINQIMQSLKKYKFKKSIPIMFEYVLLKNFNDKDEHAIELAEILKDFHCKINIIPFNDINNKYTTPSINRIESFAKILQKQKSNFRVLIRWSKGQDIGAACGQLATENEN